MSVTLQRSNPSHYRSPAVMGAEARTQPRSRFRSMAMLSARRPPRVGDVLSILLPVISPDLGRGCEALRPLWAEEAMHRAYSFIRLMAAREHGLANPIAMGVEEALARDLTAQFRSLEDGGERLIVPCSRVLREVVAGLGALFGSAATIVLHTDIQSLSLPGYKRRALVLAAAELVINALLHGYPGQRGGRVDVTLACGPASACLRVSDDGIGFGRRGPNRQCGIAAGLAGLLESTVDYDRIMATTIARICLPI